jgi:hypothetical protein
MRFFDAIDQDKLLRQVLPRLSAALESWQRGMAADETALMNQITSEFNSTRARRCDIGRGQVMHVSSELFELHRKGGKQVDRYGSDLALTVTTSGFTKTAFFQFKISKDGTARVERSQIEDAKVVDSVYDRAFVFTVDRDSRLIRLQSIDKLAGEFGTQDSMGFDIDKWENFSEWLLNWLRCRRGKATLDGDAQKIEELLRRFSIASRIERLPSGWELPSEYLPAQSWLETSIKLTDF